MSRHILLALLASPIMALAKNTIQWDVGINLDNPINVQGLYVSLGDIPIQSLFFILPLTSFQADFLKVINGVIALQVVSCCYRRDSTPKVIPLTTTVQIIWKEVKKIRTSIKKVRTISSHKRARSINCFLQPFQVVFDLGTQSSFWSPIDVMSTNLAYVDELYVLEPNSDQIG